MTPSDWFGLYVVAVIIGFLVGRYTRSRPIKVDVTLITHVHDWRSE